MQPRIQEIATFLQTQRTALSTLLDELQPAVCEVRPSPYQWSVAEIVAHIAVVEGQVTRLLNARLDAARANGINHETSETPVVPTLDVARLLDRSHKITASDASQPQVGISLDSARAKLNEQRLELLKFLASADGLALEEIVATNPAFGPLNAYQWLVFIGGHEARHTAQIRETAEQLQPLPLA